MKIVHLAALTTLALGVAAGGALAVPGSGGDPSNSSDSSIATVDAGNDPQARSSDVGGPDPSDAARYGARRTTGESPFAFFRRIFRDQRAQ